MNFEKLKKREFFLAGFKAKLGLAIKDAVIQYVAIPDTSLVEPITPVMNTQKDVDG